MKAGDAMTTSTPPAPTAWNYPDGAQCVLCGFYPCQCKKPTPSAATLTAEPLTPEEIDRAAYDDVCTAFFAYRVKATIQSLQERVRVLEGALRPFAAKADAFQDDAWGQLLAVVKANMPPASITVGDFRRAATALKPPTSPPREPGAE